MRSNDWDYRNWGEIPSSVVPLLTSFVLVVPHHGHHHSLVYTRTAVETSALTRYHHRVRDSLCRRAMLLMVTNSVHYGTIWIISLISPIWPNRVCVISLLWHYQHWKRKRKRRIITLEALHQLSRLREVTVACDVTTLVRLITAMSRSSRDLQRFDLQLSINHEDYPPLTALLSSLQSTSVVCWPQLIHLSMMMRIPAVKELA